MSGTQDSGLKIKQEVTHALRLDTGINRQGGMTDWRDKRTKNTERWTREQKGKKHRDQDDKCIN